MCAITGGQYNKPADQVIYFDNTPLWLVFYGWWSYIKRVKHSSYFSVNMFVIRSPYIYKSTGAQTRDYIPFIDMSFVQGNNQNNYTSYIHRRQIVVPYSMETNRNNKCNCRVWPLHTKILTRLRKYMGTTI